VLKKHLPRRRNASGCLILDLISFHFDDSTPNAKRQTPNNKPQTCEAKSFSQLFSVYLRIKFLL
jgi:hypothetical protein